MAHACSLDASHSGSLTLLGSSDSDNGNVGNAFVSIAIVSMGLATDGEQAMALACSLDCSNSHDIKRVSGGSPWMVKSGSSSFGVRCLAVGLPSTVLTDGLLGAAFSGALVPRSTRCSVAVTIPVRGMLSLGCRNGA